MAKKTLGESIRYHWVYLARHLAVLTRSTPPRPCGIQIQTINRCNANCRMCPYGNTTAQAPAHHMSEALYAGILEQLRNHRSLLWFSPTLQNEPLLDDALPARLRLAREMLPAHVKLIVVTNGSLLTRERTQALIDNGMDRIDVSVDAFTRATYEKIRPGLDFASVVENTERLLAMPGQTDVRVRFVRQQANEAEEDEFARHWTARGARVTARGFHNRRGLVQNLTATADRRESWGHVLLKRYGRRLTPACFFPFAHLNILSDGRVPPCCYDWTTDHIVGDLTKQSLGEVWSSPGLATCRTRLAAWQYMDSSLCRRCSTVTPSTGGLGATPVSGT